MAGIRMSKVFAAPPEDVFAAFSDIENAAERIRAIESIEMLQSGPMAVGTRWRETRVFGKKARTEEMWVTAFQPPRSYTVEAESVGCHFTTVFTFTPEGTGTQVSMDFSSRAVSFLGRLMTPMCWLMGGSMKKCMEDDFADIERELESRTAPPASANR